MLKRVLSLSIVVFALSAWLLPGLAYSGDGDAIRHRLQERFPLSHMEMSNPVVEGYIFKPGAVLVLQADGAPAKRLRAIQANTKSPRFHVPDYARVTVAPDGTVSADPGDFTVPKGTRLSVLDLRVESDRVRVFTHTLAPVSLPDRKTAFGCAEFVFQFDPAVRERGDVAAVTAQIDRVLSLNPNS